MVTLNPYYVSGFVDGEGCFSVGFEKKPSFNRSVEVRPSFSVSQGKSSKDLILKLSLFFKTPDQNIRVDRETVKYESRKLTHLINEVIPHFDNYPLQSNKQNDFLKFKEVCLLMDQKKHLTNAGLEEIIEIAYNMNLDTTSQTRRQSTKESWLALLANK
jgi:hypothetical protein